MFLSINDHFNLFKYSIAYIRSRNNLLTFLLTLILDVDRHSMVKSGLENNIMTINIMINLNFDFIK